MAKLKARGHFEVFRVEKELPSREAPSIKDRYQRALRSDGKILERMILWIAGNNEFHDYGWKIKGTLKRDVTADTNLSNLKASGWRQVTGGVSSTFGRHVAQTTSGASTLEGLMKRTKAVSPVAKAKRAEKVKSERAKTEGPGYYVTNAGTKSLGRTVNGGPFKTLDEAEEKAIRDVRQFLGMSLTYLFPVQIIKADSKLGAEMGYGHVWWTNGKHKGPPVDPRQAAFGNGW